MSCVLFTLSVHLQFFAIIYIDIFCFHVSVIEFNTVSYNQNNLKFSNFKRVNSTLQHVNLT